MEARPLNVFLLVQGVFALVGALVLLMWPGPSALVFSFLIGVWLIADAVIALTSYFTTRSPLTIVHAVFSALLGALVVLAPHALLGFIVAILSAVAVIVGIVAVFIALALRRIGVRSWWVGVLLGAIALIAGVSMPLFPGDTITVGVRLAALVLGAYGVLSLLLMRRVHTAVIPSHEPDIIEGEILDD